MSKKKENEASDRLQMTHIGGSCLILNVSDCWGGDGCQSWSFSSWTDVCPLERELAFSSKINERLSRVASLLHFCWQSSCLEQISVPQV